MVCVVFRGNRQDFIYSSLFTSAKLAGQTVQKSSKILDHILHTCLAPLEVGRENEMPITTNLCILYYFDYFLFINRHTSKYLVLLENGTRDI